MTGLYLHIPYCESKCRYCDFYSLGGAGSVPDTYVEALLREMRHFGVCGASPLRPNTLYFGGGTPSLLTPKQVGTLIEAAAPQAEAEITLEANPHLVTLQTLTDYRAAGVNRLSLGVQSARDDSLARLGRRHTAQQARAAFAMAHAAGFENISGDLMLALPHYTSAELRETIDLLAQGGCTHISSYLLKIEPNTAFGKHPPEGLPDEDAAADFYLEAVEILAQKGYAQYEISNFAKPGFASRHNLIYWHCEDYLGLGPAAHSCMGGKRFYTKGTLREFLAGPAQYEPDGALCAADFIMLQLRLQEGLSLDALKTQWNVAFSAQQLRFLETLCQNGMATFAQNALRLTPKGMLLQNSILCELI